MVCERKRVRDKDREREKEDRNELARQGQEDGENAVDDSEAGDCDS